LLDAIQRRQLSIVAGRIEAVADRDHQPIASVHLRGTEQIATFAPARIIDCTGLAPDLTRIEQPMIRHLLAAGMARPDSLNLGIDVDSDNALIDGKGKRAGDIFAVGPITRGTFWEIIAVPDIRVACDRLAQRLLPVDPRAAEKIAAQA
jgi:uncharacterized NAD(P)/FAD-binding protein YdhS